MLFKCHSKTGTNTTQTISFQTDSNWTSCVTTKFRIYGYAGSWLRSYAFEHANTGNAIQEWIITERVDNDICSKSYGVQSTSNPHNTFTSTKVIQNYLFHSSWTHTYNHNYQDEYITAYALNQYPINRWNDQHKFWCGDGTFRYATFDGYTSGAIISNNGASNNHLTALWNDTTINFATTWTGMKGTFNSWFCLAEGIRCTNDPAASGGQDCAQWYEYNNPGHTKIAAIQQGTGVYLTLWDIDKKTWIEEKNPLNKDYFDRIMNVKIYSYCMKNDLQKHINVGVIYQDIEKLYGSCLSYRKLHRDIKEKSTYNENNKDEKQVNYQELFTYHILGFQQFIKLKYEPLLNQVNDLTKQLNDIKTFIKMV